MPISKIGFCLERFLIFKKMCQADQVTNLNFKYFDDGPLVLKEVTVRLTMGSRIGVVGRNGAGKSTWLGGWVMPLI